MTYETSPVQKYGHNRSFLDNMVPREDSSWDRFDPDNNASAQYQEIKEYNQNLQMSKIDRPRFLRDNMKVDDIATG